MAKTLLLIAALSGMLAVALGAFGAHGLKGRLTLELMSVYQTAVQYHFYHTFALLIVGVLLLQYPDLQWLKISGYLFVVGLLVFSGSLYILALTGIKWLGAITPLGGLALIAGWVTMAIAIYRNIGE